MRAIRIPTLVALLLIVAGLLAACGGGNDTPEAGAEGAPHITVYRPST